MLDALDGHLHARPQQHAHDLQRDKQRAGHQPMRLQPLAKGRRRRPPRGRAAWPTRQARWRRRLPSRARQAPRPARALCTRRCRTSSGMSAPTFCSSAVSSSTRSMESRPRSSSRLASGVSVAPGLARLTNHLEDRRQLRPLEKRAVRVVEDRAGRVAPGFGRRLHPALDLEALDLAGRRTRQRLHPDSRSRAHACDAAG